jgi:hypothetical protein
MKTTVQSVLERSGYNVRSYVGRFMFGQNCLAVTLDDLSELLMIGYLFGEEGINPPADIRYDTLGTGYIVYWPKIDFCEDEDEDEG